MKKTIMLCLLLLAIITSSTCYAEVNFKRISNLGAIKFHRYAQAIHSKSTARTARYKISPLVKAPNADNLYVFEIKDGPSHSSLIGLSTDEEGYVYSIRIIGAKTSDRALTVDWYARTLCLLIVGLSEDEITYMENNVEEIEPNYYSTMVYVPKLSSSISVSKKVSSEGRSNTLIVRYTGSVDELIDKE